MHAVQIILARLFSQESIWSFVNRLIIIIIIFKIIIMYIYRSI